MMPPRGEVEDIRITSDSLYRYRWLQEFKRGHLGGVIWTSTVKQNQDV